MGSVDDVIWCKQWVGDLYKCQSCLISGPLNNNKYVIETGKVVVIRNRGTVALSGPTTIDLYRWTFGTRKKWS